MVFIGVVECHGLVFKSCVACLNCKSDDVFSITCCNNNDFALILCFILNYESDDVFPSLIEATIVSWPYFCKSCVAVMMCFPSLVEATMMFGPCCGGKSPLRIEAIPTSPDRV